MSRRCPFPELHDLIVAVWNDERPGEPIPCFRWRAATTNIVRGVSFYRPKMIGGEMYDARITLPRRDLWKQSESEDLFAEGARHLVLHELSHLLNGARDGHSAEFWRIAWGLYETYLTENGLRLAYKIERRYKVRSAASAPSWLVEEERSR